MYQKLSSEQRLVCIAAAIVAVLCIAAWFFLGIFHHSLAESILAGEGLFAYLRSHALRMVGELPEAERAAELSSMMLTILGRLTVVYVLCQTILLGGSLTNPQLFTDFFRAKSHPLNLAIFRIVYFSVLLPRPSLKKTLHLLAIPDESRVAPPGLSWMVNNLPESPQLNTALYWLFVASCVLGAIGLWTRFACVTSTLLTFYLLGITQFFGKIEHQHYLVWIGMLLSVSRCADVLSVDAFLRRRRVPWLDRAPSQAYALPLRFVWLFLGIVYFFPGLWKYVYAGPNWFLSDNLRSRMWLRWFVSEGWTPFIRVDEYPLLCKFGGLATILMEMLFIFLIFFPRARYFAAASALSFHMMVKWFLHISFWPIHAVYVSFIDWYALLKRLLPRSFSTTASETMSTSPAPSVRGVWIVGTLIVVLNVMTGFAVLDSWPIGVYPTFARVIGPTYPSLAFAPVDADGHERFQIEAFFDPTVREIFGVTVNRTGEILNTMARPHPQRKSRLTALWTAWQAKNPHVTGVAEVRFYRIEYSTVPGDPRQPISRTLLESLQPAP